MMTFIEIGMGLKKNCNSFGFKKSFISFFLFEVDNFEIVCKLLSSKKNPDTFSKKKRVFLESWQTNKSRKLKRGKILGGK